MIKGIFGVILVGAVAYAVYTIRLKHYHGRVKGLLHDSPIDREGLLYDSPIDRDRRNIL
jgi:hypothetical protein